MTPFEFLFVVSQATESSGLPWGIIGPVIVAIIAPLGAYLLAARKMSGKVATSDANALWKEASAIRDDYRDRIVKANDRQAALETRVSALEGQNNELVRENYELRAEVSSLKTLVTTLQNTIKHLEGVINVQEGVIDVQDKELGKT